MAGEGVNDVVWSDRGYLRVTNHEPIRGRYGITESRTGPACFLRHTLKYTCSGEKITSSCVDALHI